MFLQRWPPWLLVLLALVTLAAVSGAWTGTRRTLPRAAVPATGLDHQNRLSGIAPEAGPGAPVRICVTRHGFCQVGAARTGDPCGCPHPLQGNVPGHVERVGGTPWSGRTRDWPELDDADDPLEALGPLHGP